MLIVVSDMHLGDGTTADPNPTSAFYLFASRLREMAYFASFDKAGNYKPIQKLDVLLLGDILDPIHSTLWLDTELGAANYVRPWTDSKNPLFAKKLLEVTQNIFKNNEKSLEVLRRCATQEEVSLPPVNARNKPDFTSQEKIFPKIRFHYMVGNHDWYYHLKGAEFDGIRQEIINKLGLSNKADLFAHDIHESPEILEVLQKHKVFARHGDYYDKFNFNIEAGRDYATVGDAFAMEMLNRFPVEVKKQFGDKLPQALIESLQHITNVRPVLASSLWITGQIKRYTKNKSLELEIKKIWNDLCDEFLALPYVREQDKAFQFDSVDALQLITKISKSASFQTMNDIVLWVNNKFSEKERSFSEHALNEPALLNESAKYIVYGHTHHHEVVSLDTFGKVPKEQRQVYINSGTWRSYFDLAIKHPAQQKFVPNQCMYYTAFYKDGEREGRQFEVWSGTYA
jgi:UDP-2,3-diacylglucosamine pyrophosphatase LpxH